MPICATCGVQGPGPACPICEDSRQYVPPTGQRWTTQAELQATHRNVGIVAGSSTGISRRSVWTAAGARPSPATRT